MLFGYTLMFDVLILYKIFLLNSMVPMEQYVYYIVIYIYINIQHYIYTGVYTCLHTHLIIYIYTHSRNMLFGFFAFQGKWPHYPLFFWLNVIINTDCIPIVIDTPIIKIPLIFP